MERRWDNYTLINDKNIQSFWDSHLKNKERKLLFIHGMGFDPRMNLILKDIIEQNSSDKVFNHAIKFIEGEASPSNKYQSLISKNIEELRALIDDENLQIQEVEMWKGRGYNKHRVSSINAFYLYERYKDISTFTDVIIDISSMPRSIYFPIIGKLLYLIDSRDKENHPNPLNLFVGVSENPTLDNLIKGVGMDEDPNYIHGFDGGLELSSNQDKPLVWLPVLGRKTEAYLERVFTFLEDVAEISPIIPFPSLNPRRGDNIFLDYHSFLLDEIQIESQNIIYASEQNPFEVYRKIYNTIKSYDRSLNILGGCRAAITAFSSKLISLGTLLAAYELTNNEELGVGIVNLESHGYEIENNLTDFEHDETEQFLLWLTGEPYYDKF